MPKGLKIAIIGFHINAGFYLLLSLLFGIILIYGAVYDIHKQNQPDLVIGVVVCGMFILVSLMVAAFNEFTIWGLKKHRFWAWVCGIIISGLNIFSICMPLGVLTLVGLLLEDTRPLFQKSK